MTYALLMIDMQKALFEMKKPVFAKDMLIYKINVAIKAVRTNGTRIIFTQHENKSFLLKGTPGHEIIDDIDYNAGDLVVAKKQRDVFVDTCLDYRLKEEGIDALIICGLISNCCVREACISALDKGYVVFLLSDAHSTFYKQAEKIIAETNRDMQTAGVRLLTVEQMPELISL